MSANETKVGDEPLVNINGAHGADQKKDHAGIPVYHPPHRMHKKNGYPEPHIGPDLEAYKKEWRKSVGKDGEGSGEAWWKEKAESMLTWHRPFRTVKAGGFENGDVQWL